MGNTGRIFNIAHYAVHDGPGIRTTVFLKGCPVRCLWCCSPESQNFSIDDCVTRSGKTYGSDITAEKLFKAVRKDEPFWRRSNGGVTLSGGEVLAQADFAEEFLSLCKQHYIHTAIETCLFSSFETMKRIADVTDFVQFDIKAFDSELHMKLTSVDNSCILENAAWLLKSDKKLLVRVPLIPGINDSYENLNSIGKFISTHRQNTKLEILRYHRLGVETYDELGREYALPDVKPPTAKDIEKAYAIFSQYNIDLVNS